MGRVLGVVPGSRTGRGRRAVAMTRRTFVKALVVSLAGLAMGEEMEPP